MRLVLIALVVLLGVGTPQRSFADERHLLDGRLETLRRILPDAPNPSSDVAVVRDLAKNLKLASLEITPRAPLETGTRAEIPLEVVGSGRFEEIDRFFRQVALSHRLIDVEGLTLAAGPDDQVRFAGVLKLPYRPQRAPLPAPPEGPRPPNVARPDLESYNHDLALALAKSETIANLRRARRNPRVFFSELSSIVRDRPVMLTRGTLGDEFAVTGLTLGEASMRALESRLERGFFRVTEVLVVRQGACYQFEVRGKSPVVGIEAEIPLPSEDPFRQDEAPCRVDRDPPGRTEVLRGPSPKPKSKTVGTGPLSLRLRDVDLPDVFQVLEVLTGQGFLVDEEVVGRTTMEMAHVELRDVLLALEKLGVRTSESGSIRRAWKKQGTPPSLPAQGGDSDARARFAVKRAPFTQILRVLKEADPTLAVEGSPGGRASLWARSVPVSDLETAILGATGLTASRQEPVADRDDEKEIIGRRLVLRPQDLAFAEFSLAGLAYSGSEWIALAYSPTGALYAYRAGDRLADAVVAAVESTDVLLETEDGALRLALPEAGR